MVCPKCGAPNQDGARFCSACGAAMQENVHFCSACGARLPDDARFCSACGAALPVTPAPATQAPAAPAPTVIVEPIPRVNIVSPQAVTIAPKPEGAVIGAGFWRRVFAFVVDCLIGGTITFIVAFIIELVQSYALLSGGLDTETVLGINRICGFVLGVFASWLYFALQESSAKQATLGKMALGIKVTDLEGRRISFGKATGRHFAKYISGLILCLGYLMAASGDKKQALHDSMAGTYVVRG